MRAKLAFAPDTPQPISIMIPRIANAPTKQLSNTRSSIVLLVILRTRSAACTAVMVEPFMHEHRM